ncbi:MAG: PocR ligand-binding domain-containing protein [Sedimentisphaeraceae bacterium JB056]
MGNFVFLESFDEICQCFYSLFGIRIAFFTSSGQEINPNDALPLCKYCKQIREDLKLTDKCIDSDQYHCIKASKLSHPLEYVCHSGLSEYIVPLKYEDIVYGNLMIGQYRLSDVIPDNILSRAKEIGLKPEKIRDAFEKVPLIDQAKLKEIKHLLGMLTELITLRRMVTNLENRSVEDVLLFMDQAPGSNLSLSDAAKMAKCSVSTFASIFKQSTGLSFKQYQLRLKLDKAEQYIKADKKITVKEVAEILGFSDQYHFSKIYKKHKGIAPSHVR